MHKPHAYMLNFSVVLQSKAVLTLCSHAESMHTYCLRLLVCIVGMSAASCVYRLIHLSLCVCPCMWTKVDGEEEKQIASEQMD